MKFSAFNKSAFTLVELIFCIVILGILSAVALGSLKVGKDKLDAAKSIAADLEHASEYVYNKPNFSLYSANLFASDETALTFIEFAAFQTSKASVAACKFSECPSYSIYKSSMYLPNSSKSIYLADWIENGKYIRNNGTYSPSRINIAKYFGVKVDMFVKFANSNDIHKMDMSTKYLSRFYLDPLTGGFLIGPSHGYIDSLQSDQIKNNDMVAKYGVDATLNKAGRMVIRISTSNNIAPNNSYCFAINALDHHIELLPRNGKNGSQIAFYTLDNGAHACHELK